MSKKALVLHSGGMDSSICLQMAIREFGVSAVLSLGCSYGQRHESECAAAARICTAWGVEREVLDLSLLGKITHSALLGREVSIEGGNTRVIGRNGLMARLGAIRAEALGADCLFMGVIEADAAATGYRDCSRAYFDLKEQILRLDLGAPHFSLRTPLVHMTKCQTMFLADQLGILSFLLKETVTCYEGIEGQPCGQCHACRLREEGLRQYALTCKTAEP